VYSSSQGCYIAAGTHMPRGIPQCYLPPGRGDIPEGCSRRGQGKGRGLDLEGPRVSSYATGIAVAGAESHVYDCVVVLAPRR